MAKYVYAVAGQSNAVGRAPLPLVGVPNDYPFSRTKIWVPARGWETLNPADNTQSVDQGVSAHGMEPNIAYRFEQHFPGDELFIIKYAVGGTFLADLGYPPYPNWHPENSGQLFDLAVNAFTAALASSELSGGYIPLGFRWAQGETDSMSAAPAQAYFDNLTDLFVHWYSRIPALANFHVYLERIRSKPSVWIYQGFVRSAQAAFCTIPNNNASLIDTDYMVGNPGDDDVHYNSNDFNLLSAVHFNLMIHQNGDIPTELRTRHLRITEATNGVIDNREGVANKMNKNLLEGEIGLDLRAVGGSIYFRNRAGNLIRVTGEQQHQKTSSLDPTFSFIDDPQTGIFSNADGTMGIAIKGIPWLWITKDGHIAFGKDCAVAVRDFQFRGTSTDDCTLQMWTAGQPYDSVSGFNLAILKDSVTEAPNCVQFWNWMDGWMRWGINGEAIMKYISDTGVGAGAGEVWDCLNMLRGKIKLMPGNALSNDPFTIDAYKEVPLGTSIPTLYSVLGGGHQPTYADTGSWMHHTRIGNLVTVNFQLNVGTVSVAGDGPLAIGGMPYAAKARSVAHIHTNLGAGPYFGVLDINNKHIELFTEPIAALSGAAAFAGKAVLGAITYMTDDANLS